jgi:hypothetical protein
MSRFTLMVAVLAAAFVASISTPSLGAIYIDAQNEIHNNGDPHMDITQVEVTNDATNISFKISVRATNIDSPNWGKYTLGLDTAPGGNSMQNDNGNGWSRSISMNGMDYWIGSWVDGGGGGANLSNWTGTNWNSLGNISHLISGPSITLTTTLASLGLSYGSVVKFDAYTTGGNGGDGANDASSNPNQASPGWPDHYHSGDLLSSYTVVNPVAPIPEASAALVWALVMMTFGMVSKRNR